MKDKNKEVTCYTNRELSWLQFNERVLNEAGNERVPLAERLTFASIYQSNLDEFFMVRVGTLMMQMNSKEVIRENKTGMTSEEQVSAILKQVNVLEKKDVLLSYPFESMKPFLKMLQEAAEDDSVVSIKMTLYRVAERSKVIDALVEAAENGKEVVVLVELRARYLLSETRCQGIYREHQNHQYRRTFPGTLQNLPVRQRRGGKNLYCICRFHDQKYDTPCGGCCSHLG